MTIDVLVCNPDGTQSIERREVPDDWFESREESREESQGDSYELTINN